MPFAGYADFQDCVMKNGDKSSPKGFCAWLEHDQTGKWPGEMEHSDYPEEFWTTYNTSLKEGKVEKEAYDLAIEEANKAGYQLARFGFFKNFDAPKMKSITGVRIFATGKHVDSVGQLIESTDEDLDNMIKAFRAGVPGVVPIKLGHTPDPFNKKIAEALEVPVEVVTGDHGSGQIALGRVSAMNKVDDFIVSSFDRIPEQIANLIESGLIKNVSVEIENKIGEFGPVITGVALLGAEEPSVEEATLERALVFGGSRKGARVVTFSVNGGISLISRNRLEKILLKLSKLIKGNGKKATTDFHTTEERMRGLRWAATELGLSEEATIDEVITALEALKEGQPDNLNKNKGEIKEMDNLPESLKDKTKEELKAMSIGDLAKEFKDGELPKLADLSDLFQEGDLGAIATALGLPEGATLEDVLAAIDKLKGEPEPEGEMKGEVKKEFSKMSKQLITLTHDKLVRAWEDKTRDFKAIAGTPKEIAIELAELEEKTDHDTADKQYTRLQKADEAAAKATERVGTKRNSDHSSDSDFEKEVIKYQKEHKDVTRPEALEATINAYPDLYHEDQES